MSPVRRALNEFRAAQRASWAGRHADAVARFAQAADADLPHLALQQALALARAGDLPAARALLDGAEQPSERLFAAWLAARAGDGEELEGLAAAMPENRVAATMLAHRRALRGDLGGALAALEPMPGDNFEVLAWCWVALEQALLGYPVPGEEPLPSLDPPAATPRAARRWLRAGIAAAHRHENTLLRRWLAERVTVRPLRRLLDWFEQRWPTDPLRAFRLAEAAGLNTPPLHEYLGAELYGAGRPAQALEPLRAASAAARTDGEQLTEEACRPLLFLAAALLDLRRWDEVESLLVELGGAELAELEDAGRTHEFAAPVWLCLRGRLRAARGESAEAQGDLQAALEAEPVLFDERLTQIRELWSRIGAGEESEGNQA